MLLSVGSRFIGINVDRKS